jgi:alkylation response protein AidB-like acyl-CoA dehydrogenase
MPATTTEPASIFEDERRAAELLARIAIAKDALRRALAEGENAEVAWIASVRRALCPAGRLRAAAAARLHKGRKYLHELPPLNRW